MASKVEKRKDKIRRHSKQARIDPSRLAPGVAAGLAQGREEIEAADQAFAESGRMPSGVEMLRRWEAERGKVGRVPTPKFIAQNTSTGFIRQRPDGSKVADAVLTFEPSTMRAMREGMICMRCLEPQPHTFADEHIEGCEGVQLHGPNYMKDRQIIDLAMEFEGEKHIGPSKPMQEFLDAQDERVEKREFVMRVLNGGQGRIPKEWLQDKELMDGLHPSDQLALIRASR